MSEKNFAQELLVEHNKLRKQFGNVDSLELDKELSEKAQAHASNLAERQAKLENSNDETVGENLYYLESDDNSYEAQHIVDYWVKKSNIDLSNPEKPNRTNHFTQIVWKSSSKLGVGVAQAENGGIYVVAFYFPRGNIVNYLDENVIIEKNNENSSDNENTDSSDSKNTNNKKEKRPEDKVNQALEKIVKKADKEKTGKISLTKAKKVFQLINEKFGTNYSNMDAKLFFEKFENLDEEGKIGHKEFRKGLSSLQLKLHH